MFKHITNKCIILGLILGLCSLIGCTSSTSPSRTIPCAELSCIACYVAQNVTLSNTFINEMLAMGKALASGSPHEEEHEGWRRCSWDYKDVRPGEKTSFDVWIKLLDTNDQLIEEAEPSRSGPLDKIWASGGIWSWFDHYSWILHIGEGTQRPFKFEGLAEVDGICTINGITSCTAAWESTILDIVIEYPGLTRSNKPDAYPKGRANFTVFFGDNVMCAGHVTFNGSPIALLTFTTGESGICEISL